MKAHEGENVLPLTFLTSARYEGEWIASRPCRFTFGKGPEISTEYEAKCPLVPVWRFRKTKGSLAHVGNRTKIRYPEWFLTY